MPTVCVRVTEGEKRAWENAAGGPRKLSSFVRLTINERLGGTPGANGHEHTTTKEKQQ